MVIEAFSMSVSPSKSTLGILEQKVQKKRNRITQKDLVKAASFIFANKQISQDILSTNKSSQLESRNSTNISLSFQRAPSIEWDKQVIIFPSMPLLYSPLHVSSLKHDRETPACAYLLGRTIKSSPRLARSGWKSHDPIHSEDEWLQILRRLRAGDSVESISMHNPVLWAIEVREFA